MSDSSKDMTKGPVGKTIFIFSLPILLGNFFQQLYNITDSFVIGQSGSISAIGAVGTSFPVTFLLIALALGLSMGGSVVISQLFGAKMYSEVKRAVSTSLIICVVSAVIFMILGLLVCEPMLRLMKTPPSMLEEAKTYINIFFIGLLFTFAFNTFSSIFRALGDSRTPLYFLAITAILNIILDLIFVLKCGWGVAGVGWATLIAQAVSVILCILYIYKKKMTFFMFKKGEFTFDYDMFIKTVRFGIPSAMQQAIISIGFLIMQRLVNSFGAVTAAAVTISSKIEQIATIPNMNLGVAAATFAGQNVGAGRFDRVRKAMVSTFGIAAVLSVFTCGFIFFFGKTLAGWFLAPGESDVSNVLQQAAGYIDVVSYFLVVFGVMTISNNILRGTGDAGVSMLISFLSLGGRVVSAYLLVPVLHEAAIWWSVPIGWAIGAIAGQIRFWGGKWKKKAIVHTAEMDLTEVDEMDADLEEPVYEPAVCAGRDSAPGE